MPRLALYGHVNIDVISQLRDIPAPDTTVEITQRKTHFGGTAGNIAAVAASLGANVTLASFIGEDFPTKYRTHLESLGIDLAHLVTKDGYGTPTWWGFTDPEHRVLGILDQGPMRDLERFELLTGPIDDPDTDTIHFATGRPAYYVRLAERARAAEKTIIFDPGQELLPLYDAKKLESMLEHADIAFFNNHELEHALAKLGYGDPQQLFDHELEAIIETRGKNGSRLHLPDGHIEIPPVTIDPAHVKDTTGAGDAYRAGFHAARQDGQDLIHACHWGSAAAAHIIQHVGGQTHLPTRQDLAPAIAKLEA